jgi:hypothetical protein
MRMLEANQCAAVDNTRILVIWYNRENTYGYRRAERARP